MALDLLQVENQSYGCHCLILPRPVVFEIRRYDVCPATTQPLRIYPFKPYAWF